MQRVLSSLSLRMCRGLIGFSFSLLISTAARLKLLCFLSLASLPSATSRHYCLSSSTTSQTTAKGCKGRVRISARPAHMNTEGKLLGTNLDHQPNKRQLVLRISSSEPSCQFCCSAGPKLINLTLEFCPSCNDLTAWLQRTKLSNLLQHQL